MKALEKARNRVRITGGNIREAKVRDSKILFDTLFNEDPSYHNDMYVWRLGFDKNKLEKERKLGIRMFKRKFSNANGNVVEFMTTLEDTIDVGNVLYDSIEDEFLICTATQNLNNIHKQGSLTVCNWILRHQTKDLNIVEYPCYAINATQYNSGERATRVFTMGTGQHMILLPADDITIDIRTPQRFFLDKNSYRPVPYIVSQSDTTSMNYGKIGIVRLTLFESVITDVDNVPLKICDFKTEIPKESDNSGLEKVSKSVISYRTINIKSGGSSQTFTAQFYDKDGKELLGENKPKAKWNIISFFTDKLKVKQTDDAITIGIDDNNYIDEDIKLVLSDDNGNYVSELLIHIVPLF